MIQMIDTETGLTMTMAAQAKPQNPRLAENNIFQIVTWTKGLGDTHKWHDPADFHTCIKTRDHLIYRLQTCGNSRHPTLALRNTTDTFPTGYAFAPYDLLRLEFDVSGDIGPEEVARALELLEIELLTYEEYLTGQVYSFTVVDKAGAVLEAQDNIYGEDYAEHLAKTAFDNHRMGIVADSR